MKVLLLAIASLTLLTSPAVAQTDAAPATATDAAALDAHAVETLEPSDSVPAGDGAQEAAEGEQGGDELGTLTREAMELARAGKWFALLGSIMLILVAVCRRFVFRKVEWFQTQIGGYTMSAAIAVLTIAGLSFKAGFSMDVVLAGLSAAGLSAGLHTVTKDVKARRSG